MSRRLLSMLLAAVAAVTAAASTTAATLPSNAAQPAIATSTSESPATDIQTDGTPVLSVYSHGPSARGSGGRLFIRTDAPGSLDVEGVAPTGNSRSDPGRLSLVASKNAEGWDAASLVSPGPLLLSEWHWQTGAGSLAVALSYVGPDGSTTPAAVQTIVAVSDRPVVNVEEVTGQPNTTTASLAWTETDGIGPGIVDRQILREEAPATTQGCGEWTKHETAGIAAAEVKSTAYVPASEANAAATADGQDGLAASSVALPIADLSLGHCYRFTLYVTDALGLVGQDTSPVYVPGLLDTHGQPLPAWTGKVDIFRASAFAPQQERTWCVAASAQMMVNLIHSTSDSSYAGQLDILDYARDNDQLPDSDAGAGLIGWQQALDKFSGTPYEVETVGSLQGAINLAALRIRLTNRPVGLAVHNTTHAWVMTGFEATADPAFDQVFTVTAVYVSGPLYPRTQSHGYDMTPDTRLTISDLGRYFTPVYWKSRLTWKFVAPLP
jgi:hypothetical protein